MVMPKFTGKYASIRKDFYKDSVGKKYDPNEKHWVGNKLVTYKTEAGFRNAMQKKFAKDMAKIDEIENAGYPAKGTMNAWYPARSHQAQATVSFSTTTGSYKDFHGGPTGGWGYDKMSTALADALNKSPEFMKLLMDARAKKKTLSYGVSLNAGKPFFPRWDGGVGIECYITVLKSLGYNVEWVYTAIKDSDTYTFTLKSKKR